MSKRAEEAAMKAYPHFTAENITEVTNARHIFAKGYEQAEKETIKLAQLWVDSGDANVMSFEQFLKRI